MFFGYKALGRKLGISSRVSFESPTFILKKIVIFASTKITKEKPNKPMTKKKK